MEAERIEIQLLAAPDDGPLENPEYQQALRDFEKSLRTTGFTPGIGIRTIDAAAGDSPAILNGVFSIATAALPVIGVIFGAWLKGRYGRKMRLKIGKNGEIDAEAQTVEEVNELVEIARKPSKPGSNPRKK